MATPLPIQLLANMPWKTEKDGSSTWTCATFMADQDNPALGLATKRACGHVDLNTVLNIHVFRYPEVQEK